jgi:hypothetical protein
MSNIKDISQKIQAALSNGFPKTLRFAVVFLDPIDGDYNDVGVVSNMSDRDTTALLKEGIDIVRDPDEAGDLIKEEKKDQAVN